MLDKWKLRWKTCEAVPKRNNEPDETSSQFIRSKKEIFLAYVPKYG